MVFLAVGVLSFIRWQRTLTSLGDFLTYSQRPESADLILVLGGDFWGARVLKGADLGNQGYAPVVLFSGPPYKDRPEGEFAVQFLVEKGYAKDRFQVFGHNEPSTIGEAKVLCPELARRNAKRVILVTSAYHSRRAAIAMRLFCPGIRFISAPADSQFHAERWWKDQSSRDIFFSEWSKILGSVFVSYPIYRFNHWGASTGGAGS